MTSNNLSFSVIPNSTNTFPTNDSNPAPSIPTPRSLSSYTIKGVGLAPLSGIPVLLSGQPGFIEAIATWSLHHQPTAHTEEDTHAVFRPETTEDVARIVHWARTGGFKVVPRSGGVGGASGRGGICLDLSNFNR